MKTLPESYEASSWQIHSKGRTKSSANNSILCEPIQQVKGNTTEHTHMKIALNEKMQCVYSH